MHSDGVKSAAFVDFYIVSCIIGILPRSSRDTRTPAQKEGIVRKKVKGIALFLVVLVLSAGCAPLLGTTAGLAAKSAGTGNVKAVAIGVGVLTIALIIERMFRANALARGVTNCQRQERYSMGRLAVDEVNCGSYTQRPGFRGDPLPAPPVVPDVQYLPAAVNVEPYAPRPVP